MRKNWRRSLSRFLREPDCLQLRPTDRPRDSWPVGYFEIPFSGGSCFLPEITFHFQKLHLAGYWIQTSIVETALREVGEV